MRIAFTAITLFAAPLPAQAELDLKRATVERLGNGLTVIALEERALPIVSVHLAYRAGGRDDPAGRMGLAHFFEHMAFRQSKNFPETRLVSSIYAAGGEWHGYTWIDQTNYYATAPRENLDLLLRIEADRMARLVLAEEDVAAETGAVIAEMNSYADDPSTVLFDALMATMFQVHPYGNNTIGYAADVKAITRGDLADFYARYYRPANAVLAIVGDIDARDAIAAVKKRFGSIKAGAPTTLSPASEPPRRGERRVIVEAETEQKLFKIAYPAPPARSDDFAAFLLLQKLIGGGSGVSFLQNEWGDAVTEGALAGVTDDLTTWFIPTADPYAFVISGAIAANVAALEASIQKRIDSLAAAPVDASALQAARDAVRRDLRFDLQTTEDAAHQLAYFESIGAFDRLLSLDEDLAGVSVEDVQRLARSLRQDQRTVAWLAPASQSPLVTETLSRTLAPAAPREGAAALSEPMPPPVVAALPNGVTTIVQRSTLSKTAAISVVAPGCFSGGSANAPAPGYTSFTASGAAAEFSSLAGRLASTLSEATATQAEAKSEDPQTRLAQAFESTMQRCRGTEGRALPYVVTASGDIAPQDALAALAGAFGAARASEALGSPEPGRAISDRSESIAVPRAQAALGYIVRAPGGAAAESLAWRIALYILAHDYGGRLGDEAISRRGLLYYIGADYAADEAAGWITLSMGVDPEKLAPLRDLLKAELRRLVESPPTAAEIDEAKRHLIGRRISAAQSNEELVKALAAEWTALGELRGPGELAEALSKVTRDDVLSILPAFVAGGIISVDVGAGPPK